MMAFTQRLLTEVLTLLDSFLTMQSNLFTYLAKGDVALSVSIESLVIASGLRLK